MWERALALADRAGTHGQAIWQMEIRFHTYETLGPPRLQAPFGTSNLSHQKGSRS